MIKRSQQHVHKYIKTKIGDKGYVIYKCTLPGCTHFIAEKLALNRKNICWRCGNEHIITKLQKKPHCDACTKGNNKRIIPVDQDLLKTFENLLQVKF